MRTLALLLSLLSASCASLVTGSTSSVTIDSVPQGASFTTDTGLDGTTPAVVILPNGTEIIVTFSFEGESLAFDMKPRMSSWIVGNVLFGGFIGLIVDSVNPKARVHSDQTFQLVPLPPEEELEEVEAEVVPEKPRRKNPFAPS